MSSLYLYALGSVLVVSLVSFIGVFTLSLKKDVVKKYVFLLVSLAVGALLGDAFIHLIPEAFDAFGNSTVASLYIIVGILAFFILEKLLHWHHHHTEVDEVPDIHPTGKLILVSDGVHNFIDGLIIVAGFLVSVEVGIATTLAVILHEIPQEIGDFGVLIHSGYSTGRALLFNFLSALTAVFGALVALAASNIAQSLTLWLVPFAAGGFIYIALSDLIPELHKTKQIRYSILQFVAMIVGVSAMFLLLLVE
jgi:zinc and cadmium transporter